MKNTIKILQFFLFSTLLFSCGSKEENMNEDEEKSTEMSSESLNAFVVLNDKMEKSINQTEDYNANLSWKFESALSTLNATGAPRLEIEKIQSFKNMNDQIVDFTRNTYNDLVKINLYVLYSASGESISFEDLEGIENLDFQNNKIDRSYFEADYEGYVHIKNLSLYPDKDNTETTSELLAGRKPNETAEQGLDLIENLQNYRDDLVSLIANHEGINKMNGETFLYEFDKSMIEEPDLLTTESDINKFKNLIEDALNAQIGDRKIDQNDAEVIKDIYLRLTIPKYTLIGGEKVPWVFAQFNQSPVIAATGILTSLRSDVLQAQTLASQLIRSRIKVESFKFNKIDPLAYANTSYINQGDSLDLKVMIAAYDSSEMMRLRYWIDDTSRFGKPTFFESRSGQNLRLSGVVGDHVLVGDIEVREKAIKKWKPWKFNYSVGAPSASISPTDLKVLYRRWDNKIQVSASGYNPEKIKLTCSGCSISGKPDKDGNYIAKVTNNRAKECVIAVSATDDDGRSVQLTRESYRVFNLPLPTPEFGGKTNDMKIKKSDASRFPILKAKLGNSPLDVPYKVSEFTLYVIKNGKPKRETVKGNRLSGGMKALIKSVPKGGQITFTKIKVKGPGGAETKLQSALILNID